MKKVIIILAGILLLAGCGKTPEQKVMARFVPERSDDFVFENNYIAGRLYGKALEGNPTSPGIDIWVKTPGELVANQRYKDELENGRSYHINWGNGKDCYKVAVSLGGGASAILIDGKIQYPATNFHDWEIVKETPEKVIFSLYYPEWETKGEKIALKKTITVTADTYFCKVEDEYVFSGEKGDELEVAAGVFRHPSQKTIESEYATDKVYAIWEHASDQSVEPEDGMIGVAVYCPDAQDVRVTEDGMHGICCKTIKSGEVFTYYFGSCWSKGDITCDQDWYNNIVNTFNL